MTTAESFNVPTKAKRRVKSHKQPSVHITVSGAEIAAFIAENGFEDSADMQMLVADELFRMKTGR